MFSINKLHRFFAKRLFILAILSLLALMIGQVLGRSAWQAELFSHFVPYYALVLLLAGLIKPIKKNRVTTTFRAIFLVVAMGLITWCLPSYQQVKQQIKQWHQIPKNSTEKQALIAYQNVNINNKQKQATLAQLTKYNPQIVILLEAGGDWSPYLEKLKQTYPNHCGHNEFSPFSMQVFTKDSQTTCEVIYLNPQQKELPIIKLTLTDQQAIPFLKSNISRQTSENSTNRTLSEFNKDRLFLRGGIIYVIHPPPPINQKLASNRLAYLQKVKTLIQNEARNSNVMVIGDINATAFSPIYREFIKDTGLQANTSNGLPTWLPFAIGIDHYFSKKNCDNCYNKVLPIGWYGSDHRGLIVYQ